MRLPPPVIQSSPRSEGSACFCIDQGIMEKDISPSLSPLIPLGEGGRGGGEGRGAGEEGNLCVCFYCKTRLEGEYLNMKK